MTLTQVELVQITFAIIAPIADDAAALFYRRLFEIDPSLQKMCKDDMADQRRKLMHMLTAAVIHFRQHFAGVPGAVEITRSGFFRGDRECLMAVAVDVGTRP